MQRSTPLRSDSTLPVPTGSILDSPRITILVVEDDRAFRSALRDVLEEHGFDVITAENGEQGLLLLRNHRHVDVVVLDVTMPVMNGATFRGEQLADPALALVPLIVMTGREDCAILEQTMAPSACLRKPFSPDTLLQAIVRSCVG